MVSPVLAAPAHAVAASPIASRLHSGIPLLDRLWGGLYRGGSYLFYGRSGSGRDFAALRFAQAGVELGEPCLIVSPARPKDLTIQAAALGMPVLGISTITNAAAGITGERLDHADVLEVGRQVRERLSELVRAVVEAGVPEGQEG